MSDELKDFRYYADRAEETLAVLPELQTAEGKRNAIAKAQVYATLATAAPKIEPSLPCNVGLHGYLDGRYDGTSRPCIFSKGHTGLHETDDGVQFRGLDNADFPGLGGK